MCIHAVLVICEVVNVASVPFLGILMHDRENSVELRMGGDQYSLGLDELKSWRSNLTSVMKIKKRSGLIIIHKEPH